MPTPAIQTLINDAQQVLNLDSISAVRSVVAVSLANANTGTPLNPNLTTQQLWNEFYQVVTRSKSDIESIIANQLMKFLYSPPAPGGVGANGQVIFNNNGILAGDNELFYNPTTNTLTTEKLIVPGNTQVAGSLSNLYVGSILNPTLFANTNTKLVGIGTATPYSKLHVDSAIAAANFDWTTTFISPTVGLLAASNNSSAWIRIATLDSNPTHDPYVNFLTSGGQNWSVGIDNSDSDKFKITLANGFIGSNEFVTIDTSGNVNLGIGNLAVSNGKGIDFSATSEGSGTMTSELLNDYEEGTFIVSIATGATGVTYTSQIGRYTKIGRFVTVYFQLSVSASTRDGNQFIISGLPFSSVTVGSGVIAYSDSGFIATAGGNKPNIYVSASNLEFYTSSGSSFTGSLIAANAFDLRVTATYYV